MEGSKELRRKSLKGSSLDTTNNRMELTAAIEALRAVKSGNPVVVRSNSQYVVLGMTKWLSGWKAKGWLKADKKPVPNRELWEELDALAAANSVTWERVKGEVDQIVKEVDRLAIEGARLARWAD
jgi:ribonuclease HI